MLSRASSQKCSLIHLVISIVKPISLDIGWIVHMIRAQGKVRAGWGGWCLVGWDRTYDLSTGKG